MSFFAHNLSPEKWWHCSHPVVCVVDIAGVCASLTALFFVETLMAQLFVAAVAMQFGVSFLYHRRYDSLVLQSVDISLIMLLIVATVLPYLELQIADNLLTWQLLVAMTLSIFCLGLLLKVRLTILIAVTQAMFGCVSIWVMIGISEHIGTSLAFIFWFGVFLYTLQMFTFYVGKIHFNAIVREVQHGALLLPTTQIHVWLAAYLF